MCTTSAVINDWFNPRQPNFVPWPQIDQGVAMQMLEVIRRLEAIDKRLDAIECRAEAKQKKAIKRKLKRIAGV